MSPHGRPIAASCLPNAASCHCHLMSPHGRPIAASCLPMAGPLQNLRNQTGGRTYCNTYLQIYTHTLWPLFSDRPSPTHCLDIKSPLANSLWEDFATPPEWKSITIALYFFSQPLKMPATAFPNSRLCGSSGNKELATKIRIAARG